MNRLIKMHLPLGIGIIMVLLLATSCIYVSPPSTYQSAAAPVTSSTYQMPLPPVVNSFTVNPSIIGPGQSATLSWNVTGADTVRIDPVIGATTASGSQIVSPATTTTYILTATGPQGVVTDSTILSVTSTQTLAPSQYPTYPIYPATPANVPVINYFDINPPVVSPGESTVMSWNVANASSVSIDQGIGPVPPTGSTTLLPYYITYYTLTAANAYGTVTAAATVTVYPLGYNYIYPYPSQFVPPFRGNEEFNENNETQTQERNESVPPPHPPPPPTTHHYMPNRGNLPHIDNFQTSPPRIDPGNSAQIKWNVNGASSVNISPDIGPVPPSGTMTVKPDHTMIYKITASNSAGVVEHSSEVTVPITWPTTGGSTTSDNKNKTGQQ